MRSAATFAAIDWIMLINPHWYSTLFGFIFIGGQGLSALAFTIVISTFLARQAPMANLLKPSHFHDLGKLSLAFVMLWAYFNFSQYMLVYAANLVEEIPYFIARISHGWQYLALFLVIFHFAVPFLLLLSRDLKRCRTGWSGWRWRCSSCGTSTSSCWCRPSSTPRARTCTCCPASTRVTSSCTGSIWRRRWRSAGSGSGCSSRSWRSGRCWPSAIRTSARRSKAPGATDGPASRRGADHASPDHEYLETPPGSTYEHTDANVWIIVKFLFWLAVSAVIIHVGLGFMYAMLIERAEETGERRYPLAAAQGRAAAADAAPAAVPTKRALRVPSSGKRRFSKGYGWMNKEAGIVHIPIEDAMRLLVERGLPSRTPADGAALETPGMMPSDASAGRVMERRRQ